MGESRGVTTSVASISQRPAGENRVQVVAPVSWLQEMTVCLRPEPHGVEQIDGRAHLPVAFIAFACDCDNTHSRSAGSMAANMVT